MPTTREYADRAARKISANPQDGYFVGGIGNWASIAGGGTTLSYDAAIGLNGNGSLKVHHTGSTSGPGAELLLPGIYETGKRYQVLIALQMETFVAAELVHLEVDFGDFGGSPDHSSLSNNEMVVFNDELSGMPFDEWIWNVVQWVPSSDIGNPKLRVRVSVAVPSKSVDYDYHVGQVLVIEVPDGSAGFMGRPVGLWANYSQIVVLPLGQNQGFTGFGLKHQSNVGSAILFAQQTAWLQAPANANGDNSEYDVYVNGSYAYSSQSAAGRRVAGANFEGADEEYGPDYVGVIKGERSASEVEWQPDGNYDVILMDGVDDTDLTHRWQFETADAAAAANAMPSMGRLPQYAAAPHVGTEEEGESYYDTVLHKSRTWDGTAWQNHF